MLFNYIPRDRNRWLTHCGCALITLVGWWLTYWLMPTDTWQHQLTLASAYVSLLFIVFTLCIGPYKLLTQKRNPVNLMIRRDTGIWAGLTAIVHVLAGLQIHMGGNIQMYFLDHHGRPLANLFGFSNDLGLTATFVIVALLLLSNDLSLRLLRGSRWKWLQRSNYILIALTAAHALGYQISVQREPFMIGIVVALTLATLATQLTGVLTYLANKAERP